MDTNRAVQLFHSHSSAMAYVDVEKPSGDRGVGSAFHIGDGVFVSARHVFDGNRVIEVKITEPVAIGAAEMFPDIPNEMLERQRAVFLDKLGFEPMYNHWPEPLALEKGPFFHENSDIDLAIFRVSNIHHGAGIVDLGHHYDDWVYRKPWVMSEAIVMGYPPIPMTNQPHLVGAKAEIHTYVQLRNSPHIHFILSATPRGGFSGGLALHEGGFALGVVTSGLHDGRAEPELGFLAVLSVEPIHALLERLDMVPERQKEVQKKLFATSEANSKD